MSRDVDLSNNAMTSDPRIPLQSSSPFNPLNSTLLPLDQPSSNDTTPMMRPFQMDENLFVIPIYGYLSPVLILITVITNCLVCAVLLRKNMRSPTNALLVAIAAADLLTGVLPAPCFIYFYTAEKYRDWLSCTWGMAHNVLSDFLPTLFHTASIWLTVALAVQRYIYVCHAYRARELCTVVNAVRVIIVIYLLATLSQLSRFTEHDYRPVWLESKLTSPNPNPLSYPTLSFTPTLTPIPSDEDLPDDPLAVEELEGEGIEGPPSLVAAALDPDVLTALGVGVGEAVGRGEEGERKEGRKGGVGGKIYVEACYMPLRPFIAEHAQVYFNLYYWFRVIFIHLVPCTTLVVLNVLLVLALRSAAVRRQQLLKQNRRSESRRLAESNCTTLMLVAVVGLFLLVEFPLAVLLIILIVQNTWEILLMEPYSSRVAAMFVNFFILLSYPLNFFIYCGMSRQFRSTFKEMFCCGGLGGLGDKGETTVMDGGGGCTMVVDGGTTYESLATTVGGSESVPLTPSIKKAVPGGGGGGVVGAGGDGGAGGVGKGCDGNLYVQLGPRFNGGAVTEDVVEKVSEKNDVDSKNMLIINNETSL